MSAADLSPQPLHLDAGGETCLAFLHQPGRPARTAVLLCPPFGWEDICSYRSRRDWAQRLADSGHTAMRIDLPGSGDSAGGPEDPGRLSAWTAAIAAAADWLAGEVDAPVVAVGIGLGGLLAARAALQGAALDGLVLWATPARGRALVRELRAFSRLEVANIVGPGEEDRTTAGWEPGSVIANGYLLSAETVAELQALDLTALPPDGLRARSALLLAREDISSPTASSASCSSGEAPR